MSRWCPINRIVEILTVLFLCPKPFTSPGAKMADGTGPLTMRPSEVDTSKSGEDIVIFSIVRDSKCSECGAELWKGDFLKMEKDRPLCLECADLDHLVFLPSGDTALTRRSRKYSMLFAVVVRFSRTRRRYERQGLLVESEALERVQQECLSDEEQRRIARERAASAREREDQRYIEQFASAIQSSYPACPGLEALAIARHACQKHSGRVGRSAAAKALDVEAVDLAVRAHVRHTHSEYDRLLANGLERLDARSAVADKVTMIMERWRHKGDHDQSF